MSFSTQVLVGLALGIATGVFLGDLVAPLEVAARGYVRLLQMTVLPYVTLSITASLGALSYAQARVGLLRVGAVLVGVWLCALSFASLMPLAFPPLETAGFYSPDRLAQPEPVNLLDLYVPDNPFHALANSIVPAVVLFSLLFAVALIGVERRRALLDVIETAAEAVGRVTRFVVKLTPLGIFAIAAHAAGTLDVEAIQRIEVYLITYVAFALLIALWVLPGLVSILTPVSAGAMLSASRDALLTAFLVGDLFIVLPSLMQACATLIERHVDRDGPTRDLPASIIPMSFTFPHTGKLLSISFVLFAAWYSDSPVPLHEYPQLLASGFFVFFGSLNMAVPFLLDQLRIPADTFQLFLATSVINARVGTLVAAVHTMAIGLLGSTAIAGMLRLQVGRLLRFVVVTLTLLVLMIGGLRTGFALWVDTTVDGRAIVYAMQPLATAPVDDAATLAPADVSESSLPPSEAMLDAIRARGVLRVGLIADGIPYAFRNGQGQVVGFDIEMAQQLAEDLGVRAEYVRFPQEDLVREVQRRTIDIVMTGARVTPERAAEFETSVPYLDETLAIVTPDHRRSEFRSWDAVRHRADLNIGVQNLPTYIATVRRLLPEATLTVIPETTELIDVDSPYDGYALPAERGSVLTMLNPRFAVVIPEGTTVKMPLAYPIAGDDPAWTRYVDTWIGIKQREGFVEALYEQWILGRAAQQRRPRWSVIRNVLGWVD